MIHKVRILGVNISYVTNENALKLVASILSGAKSSRPFFIATPNPEMIVLACHDSKFKRILNSADLAIPDGVGLVWASNYMAHGTWHKKSQVPSPKLLERISGVDFMLELCGLAAKKGYTVGLLGAAEGIAKKTAEVLKKKFRKLKISFAVENVSDLSNLSNLEKPKADLLFVAFGAPKQEIFIKEQLKLSAKVAMGVGGAFDLISGKIRRAPVWMQNLGLEWFWRTMMEPQRIKRIFNATVIFPMLVLLDSLKKEKS